MKKIIIGVVAAVAIILFVGLAPVVDIAYRDTETYYLNDVSRPYEVTETYYETEPLSYEVVNSYTDTQSIQVGKQVIILGIVLKDETTDVATATGVVKVKNTDSAVGVIGVHLTFYAVDRAKAVAAGLGPPDFNSEDYATAEDPDSYLARLSWDSLDWDRVAPLCKQYNVQDDKTIQPGEVRGFSASVLIDTSKMAWRWEYTITQAEKTLEKERTVTKYRQVERQRIVTRYKRGSIFEYFRSGFESWERSLE